MKKKLIAFLLLAALAVSSLAGCASQQASSGATPSSAQASSGSGSAEPVTITFWHSMGGVNGKAIDTLVKKFNDENKDGITVEAQYQGEYDDAINKLKSAQIGSMGADLVQIYDIGTRFMIDSGWVIPMQELIDRDKWDVSQVEPNIAAYYTVDNKLYSMPFNSSTPILYYNKDIFKKAGIDKAPASFDEIAADGDALMKTGGAKMAISLGIYGWFFEQFLCKQGLAYADSGNGREKAATKVVFDENGGGLKIADKWLQLRQKGYAPNVGRGGDSGLASFSAGDAAMTLGSTASLKQILTDVGTKFEVGTAYFPKVNNDDKGGVSIGGASLWALNNKDEKKEAAVWTFVKFMVSPESQAYWNSQTGYFPITTAAHDEPVFKENIEKYPQFETAIDQLHDSAPEYAGALISVFPEARQTVESELENMLNGKQTSQQAIDNMAKGINESIKNYSVANG